MKDKMKVYFIYNYRDSRANETGPYLTYVFSGEGVIEHELLKEVYQSQLIDKKDSLIDSELIGPFSSFDELVSLAELIAREIGASEGILVSTQHYNDSLRGTSRSHDFLDSIEKLATKFEVENKQASGPTRFFKNLF